MTTVNTCMMMLEVMYDLPSRQDIQSFTITRALVEQRNKANVVQIPSASHDRDTRMDEAATA